MAHVTVHDLALREVGTVDLPDTVYDYPYNRHLLYEAVRHYLACARAGTHKVKNRIEVSGGGKKPWKQKGTGRARHGSSRSPLWRKGGTVHGPVPRDYSYRFPRKARRRALASALSTKLREGNLIVVDEVTLEMPKTKLLAGVVANGLKLPNTKVLVVYDGENENVALAARNHPDLAAMRALQLHAYHVLDTEKVVISRAAATSLGEVLAR